MGSYVISNAKEVQVAIKSKKIGVEREVEKEIKQTAKDVRTTLYSMTPIAGSFTAMKTVSGKSTTPITVTGGRARAAFTQSPKQAGDAIFDVTKYSARIGSNVEHMKYLEEGTRAHGPSSKKFLRFATTSGVVFTKFVQGIKPHRIFSRTRMMYKVTFPKRLHEAVRKGLNS